MAEEYPGNVVYLRDTESRLKYRLRSRCPVLTRGWFFATPRDILRVRFRAAQCREPCVRRGSYERLETHADSRCVGGCPAGPLRFGENLLIDVKGLFHTYYIAIIVWLIAMGRSFTCIP